MNVRHARNVVSRVAERVDAIIIDPTRFEDVEGWEQPDYHSFWLEIIEAYVGKIVFCDGWEYSTGCCIEFLSALDLGLPRLDERMQPLLDSHASELLEAAIHEMTDSNLPVTAQRDARSTLVENAIGK